MGVIHPGRCDGSMASERPLPSFLCCLLCGVGHVPIARRGSRIPQSPRPRTNQYGGKREGTAYPFCCTGEATCRCQPHSDLTGQTFPHGHFCCKEGWKQRLSSGCHVPSWMLGLCYCRRGRGLVSDPVCATILFLIILRRNTSLAMALVWGIIRCFEPR